jgi:hypothetical protein
MPGKALLPLRFAQPVRAAPGHLQVTAAAGDWPVDAIPLMTCVNAELRQTTRPVPQIPPKPAASMANGQVKAL